MAARRHRARYPIALTISLVCVAVLALSCGGGGGPMAPAPGGDSSGVLTPPNERNARAPEGLGNHAVWGIYTMVIDQDAHTIEVLDNRELAMHLNVKGILQSSWWCPAHNCIKIQFLNVDEINNIYTIKGTLVNPSWLNGFDVRAIIFLDEKGHQLLNADDYTMLYELEDDINPFRAYAKNVDLRKFASFASFSEIFEMYIPPVPKKFMIDFAIDASWPTNCEEPYDLEEFGYEGDIYPDDPDLDGIDQGEGTVFTKVYDWQSNVSEVSVDTTPITGGITNLVYNPDLDRWEATITDSLDAAPGDYLCLIAAFSADDPALGLYNYLTVTVNETPPPAVQTISGFVRDAFFMGDLDGSVVSVVNQDPLGFQPPPTTVVGGEYLVNVTTGAYDVSVVPTDMVHLSNVCWDILVTQDEDVKVNFELQDPTLMDPYDPFGGLANWYQIMGFAGRVVDEAGAPIPNATIELNSPDSGILSQDYIQSEVTDENGYFSMLNVPVVPEEYSTPVTQYYMKVRAAGFKEANLGPLPPTVNQMHYQVIALVPEPNQTPIWTESFETDSGWSLNGYYHRQLYDPSIKNISFNPAYNFVVVPADENLDGSIPPPPDGSYYLWYGVEGDGNFLGTWDPGQGPYTGGISDWEHSGYATSPNIDLTGYTTARIEFDMCFDIECEQPQGFDLMRFYVTVDFMDNLLRLFNPFMYPGTVRVYAYTQRGHNRTPIWCHYSYDISAYTGNIVNLKFDFATVDNNYNGCRGQFIDNIKVFAE